MFVRCRKRSGYTREMLGRKSLSCVRPLICETKKKTVLKRIQKLEEEQVLGGKDGRIEGKNVRVTRRDVSMLKEGLS